MERIKDAVEPDLSVAAFVNDGSVFLVLGAWYVFGERTHSLFQCLNLFWRPGLGMFAHLLHMCEHALLNRNTSVVPLGIKCKPPLFEPFTDHMLSPAFSYAFAYFQLMAWAKFWPSKSLTPFLPFRAAYQVKVSDPTFPMALTLIYAVYKFFQKRKQRNPDGPHFGGSPIWAALGMTCVGFVLGGLVRQIYALHLGYSEENCSSEHSHIANNRILQVA